MAKSENQEPVTRCFLYSNEYPSGKLFEGPVSRRDQLLEEGWADSPGDLDPVEQPANQGDDSDEITRLTAENDQLKLDHKAAVERAEAAEAKLTAVQARLTTAEKQVDKLEAAAASAKQGQKEGGKGGKTSNS